MAKIFVFNWLRGELAGGANATFGQFLSFKGMKPVAKVDDLDAAGISVGEL